MADAKTWLANPGTRLLRDREALRAITAWNRILEKPTLVRFKPEFGDRLEEQTVRLESDSRASVTAAISGATPRRKVTVFGVINHPTVADTDIKEGYTFNYEQDTYVIQDVIITLGEKQGIAEATR